MATRNLAPEQWKPYFEEIHRRMRGHAAYVDASGLRLAHVAPGDWLPLLGITYDQKGDLLDVTTEDVDHCILHPREIRVQDDADGLERVEVFDADGEQQVIRLREPIVFRHG